MESLASTKQTQDCDLATQHILCEGWPLGFGLRGWLSKLSDQHFTPTELRPRAPGGSDFIIYMWSLFHGPTLSNTGFSSLAQV